MSIVTLAKIKLDLRIAHASDDALLQILLDGSEDEAIQFMNRTQLPVLPLTYPPQYDAAGALVAEVVPTAETLAPSVYPAIFMLVKAKYEAANADEAAKLRAVAEVLLQPYRARMGA